MTAHSFIHQFETLLSHAYSLKRMPPPTGSDYHKHWGEIRVILDHICNDEFRSKWVDLSLDRRKAEAEQRAFDQKVAAALERVQAKLERAGIR